MTFKQHDLYFDLQLVTNLISNNVLYCMPDTYTEWRAVLHDQC